MSKSKQYSNHHIIGQCNRGKFNVDLPENITRIRDNAHRALHILFANNNLPQKQLEQLMIIIAPVISEDVRDKLTEILMMSDKEFYNNKFLKDV